MALSNQQIARAADLLMAAHRNQETISALPDECMPTSAADAMAIQLVRNAELGVIAGGWKVGFTTPAMLEKVGEIGPMLGAMPEDLIRETPATFSLGDFTQPIVEFEIGFRMGADLPPRASDYSQDEVLAAVDSAIIGIEIADPRLTGVSNQPIPALIADNGIAGGFVAGPDIPDWRNRDLTEVMVQAFADGEKVADGSPRADRCDAAWVVHWTANQVARYSSGLKAGDYITTGAAAKPMPPGEAREWVGRYEGIGEVAVRFTD